MDQQDMNGLFYDLLHSDMSESHQMSLWGPGHPMIYKPVTTAQQRQHSNCSTPSTPPYSQTLDLEKQMLGSLMTTAVIAGPNSRHHPISHSLPQPPPLIAPNVGLSSSSTGTKRGRKNFVDPCVLAPLKKRRIQVNMLSPDDRSKVLQKREKNKVAAEKCRVKRREKVHQTRAEYEDCLETNEQLSAQIKRLKEERLMLQNSLDSHKCVLNVTA